jgi:hypothetical protein
VSRDASITLDWVDGKHHFRLGWHQLIELQEKVDAGPYVVLQRLMNGGWLVGDISHVIRLGLAGGGMEPAAALQMVQTYVEGHPPVHNLPVAQAVMMAGCMGAPDEKVGE